jgi:hypothetical protein
MSAEPKPEGVRLATFERAEGELRWSFDTYEGKPFVSGRVWMRGPDGKFYPTKKGISVRIKEIDDVVSALEKAWRLATGEPEPVSTDDPIPFGGEPVRDTPAAVCPVVPFPVPAAHKHAKMVANAEPPEWMRKFHEKQDARTGESPSVEAHRKGGGR